MFKEFAVDPACMESFEYYSLLKRDFGFDRGRYASADVKTWVREAYSVAKASGITPVRKKSVLNFLNKLQKDRKQNVFLDVRGARDGGSWLDWYRAAAEEYPFAGVISEALDNGISFEDIIEDDERWRTDNAIPCEKTKDAIVNALLPLIRISRSVLLVDPYFAFSNNDVLARLIQKAQKFHPLRELELVTSIAAKDPTAIYERQYSRLNRKPIRITMTCVADKWFHDRYLITDRGAIKSGQGFSSGARKGGHADHLRFNITSQDEAESVVNSLRTAKADGKAESFALCAT